MVQRPFASFFSYGAVSYLHTGSYGIKNYVRLNHLGNVQVVISDKRVSICDEYLGVERFEAEVLSAVDYYPFGMMMPDRQWYAGSDSGNYRYGFNGQEKDDEVNGMGDNYNFTFRIYDSRLGHFLSSDPLAKSYPCYTPYQFAGNSPIQYIDMEGLEPAKPDYQWKYEPKINNWYPGRKDLTGFSSDGYMVLRQDVSTSDDLKNFKYYYLNGNQWQAFSPEVSCISCDLRKTAKTVYSNTAKYGVPVAKVVVGAIAISAAIPSGGSSVAAYFGFLATVSSSSLAMADGVYTLTAEISGDPKLKELAGQIPDGYLNSTIGLMVTHFIDDEEVKSYIEVSLSIIEGSAGTLKYALTSNSISDLEILSNATDIVDMSISLGEVLIQQDKTQPNK